MPLETQLQPHVELTAAPAAHPNSHAPIPYFLIDKSSGQTLGITSYFLNYGVVSQVPELQAEPGSLTRCTTYRNSHSMLTLTSRVHAGRCHQKISPECGGPEIPRDKSYLIQAWPRVRIHNVHAFPRWCDTNFRSCSSSSRNG